MICCDSYFLGGGRLIKRKLYTFLIFNLLIFSNCMFVYAADNTGDWGVNFKNWILKQASALAIAVIVIIIVPLIYKRDWSALIGTIFASGVALFFINQPETLKDIGRILYSIIFK